MPAACHSALLARHLPYSETQSYPPLANHVALPPGTIPTEVAHHHVSINPPQVTDSHHGQAGYACDQQKIPQTTVQPLQQSTPPAENAVRLPASRVSSFLKMKAAS